jgi:hypothetical protein
MNIDIVSVGAGVVGVGALAKGALALLELRGRYVSGRNMTIDARIALALEPVIERLEVIERGVNAIHRSTMRNRK